MAGRHNLNVAGAHPMSAARNQLSWLSTILLVAISYCLLGRLALMLAVPPGYATAIWPGSGVALAAVLIYGPRIWPGIWLGSFLVNTWSAWSVIASGNYAGVLTAAIIAVGACLQAIGSYWLLVRLGAWPRALESGRSIARFLIIGGPVGCLINSTIGVTVLFAFQLIAANEFAFNWLNWWVGDAIGVIIVTPIALVWAGTLGSFWRQRASSITVPLAIALFVVIVAFLIASNREQARIESEFENAVHHIRAAIDRRTEGINEVLGSLQSFYASSEIVNEEEFRRFTARPLAYHQDLQALSWNPQLTHAERPAFEQDAAPILERNSSGSLAPAPKRENYVVVRHIRPLSPNRGALGFNVYADPVRRAAIERARDSGVPAATARVQLVQAEQSHAGLLVFAPIYDPNQLIETVEQRRRHIRGYTVGVLIAERFLQLAIDDLPVDRLSISLIDASDGQQPLAQWAAPNADSSALLRSEQQLLFGGRQWNLAVEAGAGYIALHRAPGLGLVLMVGLLLCGLLGAFNLTLTGAERREAKRASQDSLTGLANRAEFEERLGQALGSCRDHQAQHALAYCDLDRFKIVNDTAGHQAGDELLKQIASLLQSRLRARDTVARLGGDEFGLLLENCPVDVASQIGEQICTDIRNFQFRWQDQVFQVGASIGVIGLDSNAGQIADVVARADIACYTAKDLGRSRVYVDRADSPLVSRRQSELQQISALRNSIDNGEFMLYQQPIWHLNQLQETPAAFELLLRLRAEDGSALPPGSSIAAAERYGIMAEVDRWVIQHALRSGKKLCRHGEIITINLSANSLDDEGLASYVVANLETSGFPAKQVCFEITETAAISYLDGAVRFMQEMKTRGCHFALDDFGAGISSFRYLKTLPVDWLKIDGALIQDVVDDPAARAMIRSIQQIAETMGIATVAEWVSDEAMLAVIEDLGVSYAQGFALGVPAPLQAAATTRFEPA